MPTSTLKDNRFYRERFNTLIYILMGEIVALLLMAMLILYQVSHRALPVFSAVTPGKQQMELIASTEPNLLAATLIRWASKAAVAAYTFDFVNYQKQIALARPYFTPTGWEDYQASISSLIATITQNQLFVNGVVSGTPVISNQGELPGRGYTWRVQIPFLVTYQSAEITSKASYMVMITIVRVPTTENPTGIGIDQFVMKG
jgi:intracellular multiplication protein IcmL